MRATTVVSHIAVARAAQQIARTSRWPQRARSVQLVVEDEGPGVPAELGQQVFQPFRKGRNVADHAPGSGIGLALVARFASLHRGRAWVQDRPGGGASFRVFLAHGQEPDTVGVAT